MSDDIKLENFYSKIKKANDNSTNYKNYDKLKLKLTKHMAIIGRTGSMKTNLVLNIIKLIGCFTRIYLFVKMTDEALYNFFIESIRAKEAEIAKAIREPSFKMLYVSNDLSDLQEPKDMYDKDYTNLLLIDDFQSENQDMVLRQYEIARKFNTTIIFIAQGFYKIHKNIRENVTYFFLKAQEINEI